MFSLWIIETSLLWYANFWSKPNETFTYAGIWSMTYFEVEGAWDDFRVYGKLYNLKFTRTKHHQLWNELKKIHWGWHKKSIILQTIFSNAFSWMKMYEFRLRFHWSMFLRFESTIFQHWFHYLNQWWLVYWRIYTSLDLNELRFHWRLFLRFQSTIFQHWFRWWLGTRQATSHYLNQ